MRTAVYTGTRNVYGDMVTACKSLLYHNGADRVIFLIEDDEFPEYLPDIVQTVNVSDQQYFPHDGPNYNCRWTYMTLMKMAVPLMFTGRALLLDIDTVVHGSLDGLWSLQPAPIYATREIGKLGAYFNAGVMLIDCELFREDAQKIIKQLNRQHYNFPEQDAINDVMRGRILHLDSIYNHSDWTVQPDKPAVITHYAAIRDWRDRPLWREAASLTWEQALGNHVQHAPHR